MRTRSVIGICVLLFGLLIAPQQAVADGSVRAQLFYASLVNPVLMFATDVHPDPNSTISETRPIIHIDVEISRELTASLDMDSATLRVLTCAAGRNTFADGDSGFSFEFLGAGSGRQRYRAQVNLRQTQCTLPSGAPTVVEFSMSKMSFGVLQFVDTAAWGFFVEYSGTSLDRCEDCDLELLSISPSSGKGGVEITLSGKNFLPNTILYWNGNPMTNKLYINQNRMTAIVPPGGACGQHIITLYNGARMVDGKFAPAMNSSPQSYEIICEEEQQAPRVTPSISINNIEPTSGPRGTKVLVEGSGFAPTLTDVIMNNTIIEAEVDSTTALIFYVPENAECGENLIKLRRMIGSSPLMTEEGKFFKVLCESQIQPPAEDPPPGNEPPPPAPPPDDPPPPPPPTPPMKGDALADYDLDGDCVLSDTEFFAMTDAWIAEQIDDLLFFAGVDAWIGQTDICAVTAGSSIRMSKLPRGLLISNALGEPIGVLSIYDMDGRTVFHRQGMGLRLLWDLRDDLGKPVANGVYLLKFGTELKKLVVMR